MNETLWITLWGVHYVFFVLIFKCLFILFELLLVLAENFIRK